MNSLTKDTSAALPSPLSNQDIACIYRKIGRILRGFGAIRIYIIRSKTVQTENGLRLLLDVVADPLADCHKAAAAIQDAFPELSCTLFDGSAENNYDLLLEAEKDGIQL